MANVVAGGIGARILAAEAERVESIRRALVEAAHAGVPMLQRKVPKDLGDARRGIVAVATLGPNDEVARIECTAPHFIYLERGTRPHMPPFGPIFQWVLRHLSKFGIAKPRMGRGGVLKLKDAPTLGIFQRIIRWTRLAVTGEATSEKVAKAEARAEQRRLTANAKRIERHQQSAAERVKRYGEAVADMQDQAADIANAIRFKIAKHGSPPLWIVRGSLPKLSEIARRLVATRQRRR